jgi:hypothetical protein
MQYLQPQSATSISLLLLFKFILQTFDTTLLILTFCVMKAVATGHRHTNILFKYLKLIINFSLVSF